VILLDTQSVIWLVQDPAQLGPVATQAIKMNANLLCLSAMSCWELGMLTTKGRMTLAAPLPQWIEELTSKGIAIVAMSKEIGTDAGTLPGGIHGDPGDRLIIATARALDCSLLTADRKILAYAAAGHLRAIDARR
jgi:PIN domain nuclease of toxin-antitoxin system